jgi:hypothetical protein
VGGLLLEQQIEGFALDNGKSTSACTFMSTSKWGREVLERTFFAKERHLPIIFGEETDASVTPMRRGPCFCRFPSCVPFCE